MDTIMLNCDLGENEPTETTEALLRIIDAANISCGEHAGNSQKTRETIQLAHSNKVMIGAHPGLPVEGGRGDRTPTEAQLRELLAFQMHSFLQHADAIGAVVKYVKLHGTLYHAVEREPALRKVYLDEIHALSPELGVFCLAGGEVAREAHSMKMLVFEEAFVDRGYKLEGHLIPRSDKGALLSSEQALSRFKKWHDTGLMETERGSFRLRADTFCVHADTPEALEMVQALQVFLKSGH